MDPFGVNQGFESALAAAPVIEVPALSSFSQDPRDYKWGLKNDSDMYIQKLEKRMEKLCKKGVQYSRTIDAASTLSDVEDEEFDECTSLLATQQAVVPDDTLPCDAQTFVEGHKESLQYQGSSLQYGFSKRKYYTVETNGVWYWALWFCDCVCRCFGSD